MIGRPRAAVAAGLLGFLVLPFLTSPAAASITKTRRPRELALTVGSGFEYSNDGETTELGYPFLLDYKLTERLGITIEPTFLTMRTNGGQSLSGGGDLETTLEAEIITERRNRPAVTLQGTVKWPTAAHEEFGTGEIDYTVGAVLSKEFVGWDADLSGTYTFVGSPPGTQLQDSYEISLATEWSLSRVLSFIGEAVVTHGSGVFRGQPGSISGFAGLPKVASEPAGNNGELTLGFAERLSRHFKLEEGGVIQSDGTWQFVSSWEFAFGEGD